MEGGNGNDALDGGTGIDEMNGGKGNDSYVVDNIGDSVDETNGGGNTLHNTINGNSGNNVLSGLAGNDTLNGNGGNDRLNGDGGNDVLNGGLGSDSLDGGSGLDKFLFNTALSSNTKDSIRGFSVTDDTIQLENGIFTKFIAAGNVSPANFVANTSGVAQDADDYLVYNTTTGALFYDTNGNTAGGAVQFATLELVGTTRPALTASDFDIV